MKRLTPILGALLVLSTSLASAQQISCYVNGQQIHFSDVQPQMINNRVMVPVRGVFEELGATVIWTASDATVTATNGATTIKMIVGENTALINNKTVLLDRPPVYVLNRVLIPLRFVSESFDANVDWDQNFHAVMITTAYQASNWPGTLVSFDAGSVIPFSLDRRLSSETALVGDKFTATLNAGSDGTYSGLPAGTMVYGHVEVAKAKTNSSPGVLGLEFDQIQLPGGKYYNVEGSLIGLDNNSVEYRDGVLHAKPGAKKDLKYVGIGAGAGTLIAVITKGNVLTSALIGAALGYLYDEYLRNPSSSKNVVLEPGTEIGMRVDQDLSFRIMTN